jgi:hypothetical protein
MYVFMYVCMYVCICKYAQQVLQEMLLHRLAVFLTTEFSFEIFSHQKAATSQQTGLQTP